jgi:hypothetical protein
MLSVPALVIAIIQAQPQQVSPPPLPHDFPCDVIVP